MSQSTYVCRECLKEDPANYKLFTHICVAPSRHDRRARVLAYWQDGLLHEIRPVPNKEIAGRYVLCSYIPQCRKGDRCTYAHSEAERDAWNRERFGPSHRRMLKTQWRRSPGASKSPQGRHTFSELQDPYTTAGHVRQSTKRPASQSPQPNGHLRDHTASMDKNSQGSALKPAVKLVELFFQTSPPPALDEDTVARRTLVIIDELCTNKDYKEAIECVKEMNSPTLMHVFVRELMNHTLEKSEHSRLMAGKLMKQLLSEKLLTKDEFCKGLAEMLEFAEDIEIDIPRFWDYMAQLVSQPLSEPALLPLSSVTSAMPATLAESSKVGSFVAKVMAQLKQECAESAVASVWRGSGLKWQELGVEGEDLEAFQKLDLLQPVQSIPGCAMCPIPHVSDLISLFKSLDRTNDDIRDWIDENFPSECNTPQFIRTLSTALLQAFVTGHGSAASFKDEKFLRRVMVLKRYVDNKKQLQLEVLYAFQIAVAKLEHPPKLLNGLFNAVYDLELVDETAFYEWKDHGKEPFGKGSAVHSLKSFFDWLGAADQESDPDT